MLFKMPGPSWSYSLGQSFFFFFFFGCCCCNILLLMRMFSYQVRAGRWKPSPCGPCCLITQINITSTTAPSLHPPALRRWNGSSLNTPWLYQKSRSAGVHHMYTHTGTHCHWSMLISVWTSQHKESWFIVHSLFPPECTSRRRCHTPAQLTVIEKKLLLKSLTAAPATTLM